MGKQRDTPRGVIGRGCSTGRKGVVKADHDVQVIAVQLCLCLRVGRQNAEQIQQLDKTLPKPHGASSCVPTAFFFAK